jgi:hypothetical protein
MGVKLDLNIQEMSISSDGEVKLLYHLHLETKEFSDVIGGGQTVVTDPAVTEMAAALVEAAKRAALVDLGLKDADKEEPLYPQAEEDPL